jgi:hypothetical protein
LYLVVLDRALPDFKSSARHFLDRADAFVLRQPLESPASIWPDVPASVFARTPRFLQRLGEPLPLDLVALVRGRRARTSVL